jgi:hypothetical protein
MPNADPPRIKGAVFGNTLRRLCAQSERLLVALSRIAARLRGDKSEAKAGE